MNNNWTKDCDFGFKVGQKAWHSRKGWGTIVSVNGLYGFAISWHTDDDGHTFLFMKDGCESEKDLSPTIFHVEQTFDYSRPKWQPEPGELCWVWNKGENCPSVRVFKEKSSNNYFFENSKNNKLGLPWDRFSPFNGGKLPDEFKHLEGGSDES